jgi:hypothetical protein
MNLHLLRIQSYTFHENSESEFKYLRKILDASVTVALYFIPNFLATAEVI